MPQEITLTRFVRCWVEPDVQISWLRRERQRRRLTDSITDRVALLSGIVSVTVFPSDALRWPKRVGMLFDEIEHDRGVTLLPS